MAGLRDNPKGPLTVHCRTPVFAHFVIQDSSDLLQAGGRERRDAMARYSRTCRRRVFPGLEGLSRPLLEILTLFCRADRSLTSPSE